MYFYYILKKFLKNFLIVFVSFIILYTLIDIMFNISDLPSSSNLFVLYLVYIALYSVFLLYPLSLIFSFLLTLNSLIKFNEFVSFYSLGFSPKKLLKPFLLFSLVLIFFMFLLQSGRLAYSKEYALAIKNANKLTTKNIFLKYNNRVIYIEKLNPILKKADNINVFYLNNNKIIKFLRAKEAFFKNDVWFSKNMEITFITDKKWLSKHKQLFFLKNFKPKILSNLQKLRNISFYDAYLTIRYFKNINVNKILSIVCFKIFTPLSILLLMVYIFYNAPIHIRISNITFFMIKSISFSILLWGIMLILYKFAKQGTLPFWSLILPFFFLIFVDIFTLRRNL